MHAHFTAVLLLLLPAGSFAGSDDPDRDFSGNWVLDQQKSDFRTLPVTPGTLLTITQQGSTIHCADTGSDWLYRTDGAESKYKIKTSSMSSESKWEGSALLINTLVSGPQNYVIEDRWKLSKDHSVLTITRMLRKGSSESEATLVYWNRERVNSVAQDAPSPASPVLKRATQSPEAPREATPPSGFLVKAGTRIPLALVNSLSTKHTAEGDRVYLETVFPVTQNGRIVIPKGSYVSGTVTEVKRAGRVKGKAELFLRFDSLTLPNGVTRDFRSRLDSSDTGNVDRQEGKIHGEGNKAGDARTVATTAGAGASVEAIAGSAAGHLGMGAGIGAATGAAAGLAGVLLSRGPDLVLPKGTTVEMVLDRALQFEARELPTH